MDGGRCPLASGWSGKGVDSAGYNPAMRFAKGAGFPGHKILSRTKLRREFFVSPAGAAKKFQRAEATTAPLGSEKRSNGLAKARHGGQGWGEVGFKHQIFGTDEQISARWASDELPRVSTRR